MEKEKQNSRGDTIVDTAKIAVGAVITMIAAAVWALVMLLILSFVAVYYIPFDIKWMVPVSVLCGVAAGIVYVVLAVRKRRRYNTKVFDK